MIGIDGGTKSAFTASEIVLNIALAALILYGLVPGIYRGLDIFLVSLLIAAGILPSLTKPWFKHFLYIPAILATMLYLSMASLADDYASLYKIVLQRFNPWDPLYSFAHMELDFLIISIGVVVVVTSHLLSMLIARTGKAILSVLVR